MSKAEISRLRACELAIHIYENSHTNVGMAASMALELQRAAQANKRRLERACMVPMTEADYARAATWRARTAARLNASLAKLIWRSVENPALVYFNVDVMACGAYLCIPGTYGDRWGGEGFSIY